MNEFNQTLFGVRVHMQMKLIERNIITSFEYQRV